MPRLSPSKNEQAVAILISAPPMLLFEIIIVRSIKPPANMAETNIFGMEERSVPMKAAITIIK